MKLKIFSGPKVMGELSISEGVQRAIIAAFTSDKPYFLNVRVEQKQPITFLRRMSDHLQRYTPDQLLSYGATIQGNPADIYYLMRKGKL